MHCGIGFLYLLPFSLLKKPKKEANRIKKTVKFATTPSPPSSEAAASPFSGLETNDTGTNTMGVDDGEDDYEGAELSRLNAYSFSLDLLELELCRIRFLFDSQLGSITIFSFFPRD